MNPSYNASFGGTSSGGGNPGGNGVPVRRDARFARPVQAPGVGFSGAQGYNAQPLGAQNSVPPLGAQAGVQPAAQGFGVQGASIQSGLQSMAPQPVAPQPMAPQPVAMGVDSGDIMLAGVEEKKSKKWIVVLVVVMIAIILAVVGVVAGMNMGGGKKVVSGDVRSAFNRYANYFLYGEDKTDDVEAEPEDFEESYFAKNISSDGYREYLETLKQNYTVFYDTYKPTIPEEDTYNLNYLDEYNKKFILTTTYYSGVMVLQGDILRAYIDGGEGAAKTMIEETLAPYKEVGELFGENYYYLASERAKLNLEYIMAYEAAGCLVDGAIDYNCAVEKGVEEEDMYLIEEMSKDRAMMDMILHNSEDGVYGGIFKYQDLLYRSEDESDNE